MVQTKMLGHCRIEVCRADITSLPVDAIANAANRSLLGGGGVDGAIHRAAGPGLLAECRQLGGCPTGEARVTGAYNLPAAHVIHTVGPRYYLDGVEHERLLADAYRNSLKVALQLGCKTVAFPAISTGVYGYPIAEAAQVAVNTVMNELHDGLELQEVIFCCFNEESADAHLTALGLI